MIFSFAVRLFNTINSVIETVVDIPDITLYIDISGISITIFITLIVLKSRTANEKIIY